MSIITIQRRARELGRIRIGQVVASANGKMRPEKLDRFRMTASSKELIEKVAALYGGEAREWQPQGGGAPGWEVVTTAARLPVLVPPQPVSQFFELWSGGGCQRRCDGQRELLTDTPCVCDPDPEERECKPTTRLNVVLRDVPGVGVWRLETHGWYAATELPAVAEMLSHGARYLEAWLALEERAIKRDGKTRRFIVPTFEVDITFGELMSGGTGNGTPELPAASGTDDEAGRLWQQILATVPADWSTSRTEEHFYQVAKVRPEAATVTQLQRHLTWLTSRKPQAAGEQTAIEQKLGKLAGAPSPEQTVGERVAAQAQRVMSRPAPNAIPDGEAQSFDFEAEIERCERELDLDGIRAAYNRAAKERSGDANLRALLEYAGTSIKEMLEEQRQAATDATDPHVADQTPLELLKGKDRDALRREMFALLGKGGITDAAAGREARLTVCSRLPVVGRVPRISSTDELSDLEIAQIIVALRRYDRAGTLTETLAAMAQQAEG